MVMVASERRSLAWTRRGPGEPLPENQSKIIHASVQLCTVSPEHAVRQASADHLRPGRSSAPQKRELWPHPFLLAPRHSAKVTMCILRAALALVTLLSSPVLGRKFDIHDGNLSKPIDTTPVGVSLVSCHLSRSMNTHSLKIRCIYLARSFTTSSLAAPAFPLRSIEFFTFPAYFTEVNATHTCLSNFKKLTGAGVPVRIGGTTQDRATFAPTQTTDVEYSVASAGAAPLSLTFGIVVP